MALFHIVHVLLNQRNGDAIKAIININAKTDNAVIKPDTVFPDRAIHRTIITPNGGQSAIKIIIPSLNNISILSFFLMTIPPKYKLENTYNGNRVIMIPL